MKIFIGGSKTVSEIDDNGKDKLLQMIKNGSEILIGDTSVRENNMVKIFLILLKKASIGNSKGL